MISSKPTGKGLWAFGFPWGRQKPRVRGMFTGLIETVGCVRRLEVDRAGKRLALEAANLAPLLKIGASLAVNGVCLTVVENAGAMLVFDVGPETLARTNLGDLAPGDFVNLERSLKLGDELGGHLVQGHVDGLGTIASRKKEGDWELLWCRCPPDLAAQMASKGSVAVDGVSLTVVDVSQDGFSVALIPHTLANTTLGRKPVGGKVNLEIDVLAKYVWKFISQLNHRGTEAQRE